MVLQDVPGWRVPPERPLPAERRGCRLSAGQPAKNSEVLVEISGTTTKLVACSDWSLNCSRGTIDVSTIGTEWKEYPPGQISADGSTNLLFDPTNDEVATQIETAMWEGTELTFHIRPEGTGADKVDYKLSAYITAWNVSGATEDAIKVAVNFQGTGPIEKTKQTA